MAVAWINTLDEEDRLALLTEVLESCVSAAAEGSTAAWERVGDVIHQWRESAAVAESEMLLKAMSAEADEQPLPEPATK